MTSESDKHPRCEDVLAHRDFKVICLNNCACYREKRPAYDQDFCSRMILTTQGNRGECAYGMDELPEKFRIAQKKLAR